MILLCRPSSCCCSAVFSPFKEVICCCILLFSAFWKLKCLFLSNTMLTFPPRCGPARWKDSSWHPQSSWWGLTPVCPSHCAGSGPTFCGCWASWRCFWFVAGWGDKYLECLQFAFEGSGVGAEAVAGLVHLIKILIINQSYLFYCAKKDRTGVGGKGKSFLLFCLVLFEEVLLRKWGTIKKSSRAETSSGVGKSVDAAVTTLKYWFSINYGSRVQWNMAILSSW